ncbi:cell division membrane protein [Corynebacterium deserti GIMN1.010]|uniref:Probable peptidoglycan glycosyltransferase FtsW n=1 Tax=Corynebacterium deserti GIMN1.010 TaxID=931089 RepID=A0A0M4CGY7_9CORY|nr:putative peptidoglycan glycosyltransferase FtsW [Corynebacterium deserti]ALC06340.1 cell division membrane protein [Corynebacterium deserti GIMN1.010]
MTTGASSKKTARPGKNGQGHKSARAATSRTGLGIRERISGAWNDLLARPLTDYVMITCIVVILSCLGVVMVYSSSMTWSLEEGGSVWGTAVRQGIMIGVGFFAMWLALMFRPQTIRNLANAFLVVSILLLFAVQVPGIGTGREEVGSQSWIALGPVQFQPSEIAKVAIAVWGAHYLAGKGPVKHWLNNHLMRFAAVGAFMATLIFLEGDAGMAMSFVLVVVFMLLFAGIAIGWIVIAGILFFAALVVLALGGGFRSNRFEVYFDALFGNFSDVRGIAFQSYQGFLSLADGSGLGVGLGQSRAKWFYLPEAKNDFIFAIIGEELGLWGGALVIALFAGLLYFGLRTAKRSHDPFLSLMAATLTASVVSQAFINIGYVIGLLPVTGIQLPMISAGGTSAIITLASMGLLISCARHEPETVSAMASYGLPALDRVLGLREPTSELTTSNASLRQRGSVREGSAGTSTRDSKSAKHKGASHKDARQRFGEPVTARRPSRGTSPSSPGGSGVQSEASTREAGRVRNQPTSASRDSRGSSMRGTGARDGRSRSGRREERPRR